MRLKVELSAGHHGALNYLFVKALHKATDEERFIFMLAISDVMEKVLVSEEKGKKYIKLSAAEVGVVMQVLSSQEEAPTDPLTIMIVERVKEKLVQFNHKIKLSTYGF